MSATITDSEKVKMLAPKLRFKGFNDEWKPALLGNTCRVTTGCKDTQNRIDSGAYPFFVRSNTVERINSYSFDGEAILTSGDGVGVGKNFHYINGKFDFHQRVYALLEFKENYSGKFIYQLFVEKFHKRVMRLSAKNSVDSVRMNMITEMNIGFPSLPEQQKIASFLSAVDEKIQQLSRKKELLEQYKKGVMQQLFSGKLRFKDENGKAFPKWEEKRIWEISEKKSSNIAANAIAENVGDYKIYGATGFLKTVDFYREEEPYISIVKDGAGVGRTLLCDAKTSVLGTLDIIKPIINVDLYFLYSVLNNIDFVKYTKGSTIPHIYFKDYSTEKIQLPNLKEQKKIANYLSNIDSKIESVIKQITQTQIFKKGLLQQMFV
jgi:type I restriction enzyme S subunit